MTTTAEPVIDLAAVAAAAPATGLPQSKKKDTWAATTRELAALMRAFPGDPVAPDTDPRAGWRLCGWSNNPDDRPKLSSDAMRVRTKATGDPNRGVLASFRVEPDARGRLGMFQASVLGGADSGLEHAVELHCRYLEPEAADLVRADLDVLRRAGVKRVAYRGVRRANETPEERTLRLLDTAARRAARRAARSTPTDGN